MSERLILLALGADDVCDGPRHTPAASRVSNGRAQVLADRLAASLGVPPETWVAECGARGMLFVDAPILASRPECFGCRVSAMRRPLVYRRYDNDDDRAKARRKTWRESKQRQRDAA